MKFSRAYKLRFLPASVLVQMLFNIISNNKEFIVKYFASLVALLKTFT